jgi:hypothetical protein
MYLARRGCLDQSVAPTIVMVSSARILATHPAALADADHAQVCTRVALSVPVGHDLYFPHFLHLQTSN